jgi:phosphopantothenoylcysteine decarboxylase/phosphopantothenate--cysteine ligase
MHPSEEIRGEKSTKLSHKRIVLGVTGSIAAVETIKLARELLRHDAEVIPVMTQSATKIIHPNALEFATGKKPILYLTGKTEHVSYCGSVKNPVHLLLICPCTANTLSKVAYGIDDTPVTTFATTALGSGIPILIIPAMHLSMYDDQIIKENIGKCKNIGIRFIDPRIQGSKAKMPEIDEIIATIIREIGSCDLKEKTVLIIGGSSTEEIDEVRTVSNRSTGKTAISLATASFYRGAHISLYYGTSATKIPSFIPTKHFTSVHELLDFLKNINLNKFDLILICAALSDYIPEKKKGKISSGQETLTIPFHPAPKIIEILRKKAPKATLIGFKLEPHKIHIQNKAYSFLQKYHLDYVVGNTLQSIGGEKTEVWIVDKQNHLSHKRDRKNFIADFILDTIT